MTEEVSPEVIKKTQDVLGKYVKKPPLTEKLLKKPPFRFLHDIIGTVVRETGFLEGLYTEEEMLSENIKDKEDKIKYLQKLINAVRLVTGSEVAARPSKIVAGHEPTKTNELLQLIGKALQKKLSSSIVVSQLKEGVDFTKEIKPKTKKPAKTVEDKEKVDKSKSKRDATPASRKSDEKPRKKPDEKKRRSDSTSRAPKPEKLEKADKQDKVKQLKSKDRKSENRVSPERKLREPRKSEKVVTAESKVSVTPPVKETDVDVTQVFDQVLNTLQNSEQSLENPSSDVPLPPGFNFTDVVQPAEVESGKSTPDRLKHKIPMIKKQVEVEMTSPPQSIEKVDSFGSLQRNSIEIDIPLTPPKPAVEMIKSGEKHPQEMSTKALDQSRPPTVRPRTSLRPPSARPVSARPAAPRVRDRADVILPVEQVVPMGKVNVIVENFDKTIEEDNENLVVVETGSIIQDLNPPLTPNFPETTAQGHLVAQILETQKELVDESPKSLVEIEWEADGQRTRETKKRSIENIRSKIQTVTRAVLPLGQIINFLQEDYDNITRELQMWRNTNASLNNEIAQQRTIADVSLEPLMKQYQDMNEDIEKQKGRNDALKSEILRNQQKINQLLTTLI